MFLRSSMFPSAGAQKATKSMVNRFAQAAWPSQSVATLVTNGAVSALSGAMTATTLKTLLSVSGVGCRVGLLTFRTNDATARTIRVKITVDGTVICDATSARITVAGEGGAFSGVRAAASPFILPMIKSNSTLLIEFASSLTETDKITAEYIYNTEA